MFGSSVPGFEPAAQDDAHAEATFVPLFDTMRWAIAAGLLRDTHPGVMATGLWANVHGLVSLKLRGALPAGAAASNELFEAATTANLAGWQVQP